MASIQKACTLTKRVLLSNLSAGDGLNITLMLNGPHGIGKSQILKRAAKDLGGYCFIVEGGSLKEGEVTGLPVASAAADGSTEVRFVKYYIINKIAQLERYYYEKATTTGFLNGTVRLDVDAEGNRYLTENGKKRLVGTAVDAVIEGTDNQYKFGNELSSETKLKLVESGEIKLAILFFDELNRTEQQTMKELMNIILNKSINGYDLPWWCNIVSAVNPCSQNSTYATNELDDAQLDRFLKIKVDAKLDEWTDYALENGLSGDVIEGIAIAENIFIHREKGQEDTSEMSPSPRSWEMVSHLYTTVPALNNSKFFSAEERKSVDEDLRTLIRGKVGETAARTLLQNIANKENNIKASEILTAKSKEIDKAIVDKFNRQKKLTQKIIADSVANYILNTYPDYEKGSKSTDAKKKEAYLNYKAQLKQFTGLLDVATQILFVKKILKIGGNAFFAKVASNFSNEVLLNIVEAKSALHDLNNQ